MFTVPVDVITTKSIETFSKYACGTLIPAGIWFQLLYCALCGETSLSPSRLTLPVHLLRISAQRHNAKVNVPPAAKSILYQAYRHETREIMHDHAIVPQAPVNADSKQ